MQAEKDFDDFLQPIDEIISSATRLWRYAAWESVLNIVRRASAFGAEICLQRLTSGRVKAFFKNGRRAFEKAVKKGFSSKELRVFAVPGGPHVHLSKKDGNLFFKKGDQSRIKRQLAENVASKIVNAAGKVVQKLTGPQAKKIANLLGFEKTNYRLKNQPVFKKGNLYISPDIDMHSGGTWKMANSIENLTKKETRLGTYDIHLNRIGD